MPERRDYLAVCNDQGVALNEFQQTVCVRCVQPECSRSRAGGLFETRVSSWQERLFEKPARMTRDDPRYAAISAKHFMEIDVARSSARGEWLDTQALEEPVAAAKPRRAKAVTAKSPDATESLSPPRVGALNTPFQQGTMLEGPAPAPAAKPVDPWAARVKAATPAPVNLVKTGARIKFT